MGGERADPRQPKRHLITFGRTQGNIRYCSESGAVQQNVLLALSMCALGRGLTETVLGLGQRRGGGGVPAPPPPFGGGWGPPPPPYSPPNCRTLLGVTHWLAAAPVLPSLNRRCLMAGCLGRQGFTLPPTRGGRERTPRHPRGPREQGGNEE